MISGQFQSRDLELPSIRRSRRKDLKNIFTGNDLCFELTPLEFLLIGALYQLNITYLLIFLDLAIKHGPILVCIAYVFLTAVLGMPLFMLFIFMSSYSKLSYFRFWECVPLLKGLGYSLALIRIYLETNNGAMAALILLLLFNYYNGNMQRGFMNCVYNVTEDCVEMFPQKETKTQCSNTSKQVLTSSQTFVRHVEMNYSTALFQDFFNVEWLVLVGVVWLMIFLVSVNGIRHVRKFTIIIQVFSVIIMILMCIFSITRIPWSTISETRLLEREDGATLMDFKFWVDMVLHSAEINAVSNSIWLGTLKPKSLPPNHAAIIITPLKWVVFILLECMFLCLVKENIVHYKYQDYNCFKYNSKDFLFTLIPEILFRTNIYNLFIPLWYISLFVYAFCAPLYSVIGLTDSLLQRYQALCKYKPYVSLAICTTCFLTTFLMVTRLGEASVKVWTRCAMPIITSILLLFVNLTILFIYSTKEIAIDHMFTYGKPPEKYWITVWKMAPIFAVFGFILVTRNEYVDSECAEMTLVAILSHLSTAITFIPVLVIFVKTFFKHMTDRTLRTLSNPSSEWGPYDPMERKEKKLFFPQRDIRYRNEDLKCEHKCVLRKREDFKKFLMEHREKLIQLEADYLMDSNYK